MSADGLVSLGARAAAGTVMIKYGSYKHKSLAPKGLSFVEFMV